MLLIVQLADDSLVLLLTLLQAPVLRLNLVKVLFVPQSLRLEALELLCGICEALFGVFSLASFLLILLLPTFLPHSDLSNEEFLDELE